MRIGVVMLALVGCGGGDKDSDSTTVAAGTPGGTAAGTAVGTAGGTAGGTTTSCIGAAHGTVSATGMCATGCAGDLYIGVFAQDPRLAPGVPPIAATIVYGVDLGAAPAPWSIASIIPCGSLYVAPFLDLDGTQDATTGDLVLMDAVTAVSITDGGDAEVDQDLDFVLP